MIPRPYKQMHQSHPDLMVAYEAFGKAAREAGPLSDREVSITVKRLELKYLVWIRCVSSVEESHRFSADDRSLAS